MQTPAPAACLLDMSEVVEDIFIETHAIME